MYCRICGALINDKAEICVKCGCRPYNGRDFCPKCGAKTRREQEMCVKCGHMLSSSANSSNFLDTIKSENPSSEAVNLDFTSLPLFYQEEFTKIYNSNESYKGKFNFWAFFWGAIWALTKGVWLAAVVSFIASLLTSGVLGVAYWFVYGFRGTYMYYCAYVKNKQIIF